MIAAKLLSFIVLVNAIVGHESGVKHQFCPYIDTFTVQRTFLLIPGWELRTGSSPRRPFVSIPKFVQMPLQSSKLLPFLDLSLCVVTSSKQKGTTKIALARQLENVAVNSSLNSLTWTEVFSFQHAVRASGNFEWARRQRWCKSTLIQRLCVCLFWQNSLANQGEKKFSKKEHSTLSKPCISISDFLLKTERIKHTKWPKRLALCGATAKRNHLLWRRTLHSLPFPWVRQLRYFSGWGSCQRHWLNAIMKHKM